MDVYVLTREYDYEGESPEGVYATLDVAKAAAEAKCVELSMEPRGWSQSAHSPGAWRLPSGCGEYVIRQEEVRESA